MARTADVLVELCDRRFCVAEAAAREHATTAAHHEVVNTALWVRVEAELKKYLTTIKELKEERSILAKEVREHRRIRPLEVTAKSRVLESSQEQQDMGAFLAGDEWAHLQWSEKVGVMLTVDKYMELKRENEKLELDKRGGEHELTTLKTELLTTRQIAEARLKQLTAEKERFEELKEAHTRLEQQHRDKREATPEPKSTREDESLPLAGASYPGLRTLCVATGTCDVQRKMNSREMANMLTEEQKSITDQINAERVALRQQKEDLDTQLEDLHTLVDGARDEKIEKLVASFKRVREQLETATLERDQKQATVDGIKHKAEEFYALLKKKKAAMKERIEELEKEKRAAEASASSERELREGMENELQLLRLQVQNASVQTEVSAVFEEEETARMLLVLEAFDEKVFVPPPPPSPPLAPEPEPEPVPEPEPEPAPEPAQPEVKEPESAPREEWEPGSPTLEDLEEEEPKEATISLRYRFDETGVDYSTIIKVMDDRSIGDILTIAADKFKRFGVNLEPETLALIVTKADESAMLEWIDPTEMPYLFSDPSIYSNLFSPRGTKEEERIKAEGMPAEFPYSSRQLRSLAFVHKNYQDLKVEEESEMRMWFTVVKKSLPSTPGGSPPSLRGVLAAKKMGAIMREMARAPKDPSRAQKDPARGTKDPVSPMARDPRQGKRASRQLSTPLDFPNQGPSPRAKKATRPLSPAFAPVKKRTPTAQSPMLRASPRGSVVNGSFGGYPAARRSSRDWT